MPYPHLDREMALTAASLAAVTLAGTYLTALRTEAAAIVAEHPRSGLTEEELAAEIHRRCTTRPDWPSL